MNLLKFIDVVEERRVPILSATYDSSSATSPACDFDTVFRARLTIVTEHSVPNFEMLQDQADIEAQIRKKSLRDIERSLLCDAYGALQEMEAALQYGDKYEQLAALTKLRKMILGTA